MDPKKIIDGDEERVMSMDYMFALTPHLSPSLESVGHSWEMIEIQPREVVKMLV
jgi:import inner membrane translocase subunit TIM44